MSRASLVKGVPGGLLLSVWLSELSGAVWNTENTAVKKTHLFLTLMEIISWQGKIIKQIITHGRQT